MTLDELPVATRAAVTELPGEEAFPERLAELGVRPGEELRVLGRSPLGDPTLYEIGGAALALRKTDARRIRVKALKEEQDNRTVTVALAGNPNVGKSTLFNRLTGLRQHTGNWIGKTVETAEGRAESEHHRYRLIDLPGTLSLHAGSAEEAVAAELLQSGAADAVAVICDACCLRRSLLLVLQCRRLCPRVLVCVNLIDEARRRGMAVDCEELSKALGLPVLAISAREKDSSRRFLQALDALMEAPPNMSSLKERTGTSDDLLEAGRIAGRCVGGSASAYSPRDQRIDRFMTGSYTAFPMLLVLLALLFFLSVKGAQYPSEWLAALFSGLLENLRILFASLSVPAWLSGLLLDGALRVLAWVVAVMLPPMAIFFPLFSLLEDLGFLPRVAYCLDRPFARCGACGKQSLCMMIGLGCNAVGVSGSRIIEERRERLLAILTNAVTPCNGRLPLLLSLLSIFFAAGSALRTALWMTGVLLLSLLLSLAMTRLLSMTVLRGNGSATVLELPPYRRPDWGGVLLRSFLDRTLRVLARAAAVAAPAGMLLWLLTGHGSGESGLIRSIAAALDPMGRFFGMDGAILLAFILAAPANELVLPILVMLYSGADTFYTVGSLSELGVLLASSGWNARTCACVILFSLLHWPCMTTLLTVRSETGSLRWTVLSALLPTALGLGLCALLRLLWP